MGDGRASHLGILTKTRVESPPIIPKSRNNSVTGEVYRRISTVSNTEKIDSIICWLYFLRNQSHPHNQYHHDQGPKSAAYVSEANKNQSRESWWHYLYFQSLILNLFLLKCRLVFFLFYFERVCYNFEEDRAGPCY